MADWTDGPEYAPVEPPDAFAMPEAAPLAQPQPPQPLTPGAGLAPHGYQQAAGAMPLNQLSPDAGPSRDPRQPFVATSMLLTAFDTSAQTAQTDPVNLDQLPPPQAPTPQSVPAQIPPPYPLRQTPLLAQPPAPFQPRSGIVPQPPHPGLPAQPVPGPYTNHVPPHPQANQWAPPQQPAPNPYLAHEQRRDPASMSLHRGILTIAAIGFAIGVINPSIAPYFGIFAAAILALAGPNIYATSTSPTLVAATHRFRLAPILMALSVGMWFVPIFTDFQQGISNTVVSATSLCAAISLVALLSYIRIGR